MDVMFYKGRNLILFTCGGFVHELQKYCCLGIDWDKSVVRAMVSGTNERPLHFQSVIDVNFASE